MQGLSLRDYIHDFSYDRILEQYRWNRIRKKVGLDDFKFHDLRLAFDSVPTHNSVSTAVTQDPEHSLPDLTNKVYMNVDPVL
jgi:hypothetical protein